MQSCKKVEWGFNLTLDRLDKDSTRQINKQGIITLKGWK